MHAFACLVNPAQCAATTVAKASLGQLFSLLTSWVVSSVGWLLHSMAGVLNATGEATSVVHAANPEFTALLRVSPVLLLISLLLATLHSVRRGDAATLWRSFLAVAPACVAAIVLARPLAGVVLAGVDALCGVAGSTVPSGVASLSGALAALSIAPTPGFGVFLLATLVVVGGVLLWCELVVRTVILSLLLVLVPVLVPLAAIPAMRRVAGRLAETFLVVAFSKFFIVVTLALGLSELTSGRATTVITGAVTLALASATPFVVLRLIPTMESSAMHGVDGLRQRATRAAATVPSSPAGLAVAAVLPDAPLPGPPERAEDWGIPMWEPDPNGNWELPPLDGEPPPPPVGLPTLRRGHVVYGSDEIGPTIGWHFDE